MLTWHLCAVDFMMGGVSAVCVMVRGALDVSLTGLRVLQAVAKTSAAPIERIKLLIQNQDEMVSVVDWCQRVRLLTCRRVADQAGPPC